MTGFLLDNHDSGQMGDHSGAPDLTEQTAAENPGGSLKFNFDQHSGNGAVTLRDTGAALTGMAVF